MNDFHTPMFQAHLQYGIELTEDEYEELGLIAWQKIGNKRVRTYRYCTSVSCDEDHSVELPCNADIIEAVTYGFEDWNYTDNIRLNGNVSSAFTEHYIEGRKAFTNPLYISGKFVKYERVGDKLYIDPGYSGKINILYRGQILDDDGLPELTDREVDAIAAYCAYTIKFKQYLQTYSKELLQATQILQNEWNRLCDAARVVDHISQNEMNEILDAKTSWSRKVYGKSLKLLK